MSVPDVFTCPPLCSDDEVYRMEQRIRLAPWLTERDRQLALKHTRPLMHIGTKEDVDAGVLHPERPDYCMAGDQVFHVGRLNKDNWQAAWNYMDWEEARWNAQLAAQRAEEEENRCESS